MVEPRSPAATTKFIDEYCQWYKNLFSDVRSFEAFQHLHVGCVSDIKRKTLPEIAKVTGLDNHQGLHHFLTESPWEIEDLRNLRLKLILQVLKGKPIVLIIDETGDRKKGDKTDYVKRQYIGNLGKTDNGIVAVTAYGVFCGMTFPLLFEVYKPHERLKPGDKYLSKPEIAVMLLDKLKKIGFNFNLVLADSLYGESGKNFIQALNEHQLKYIVAIRYYGLRTWVEYGLKQSKNELGWADFRVTNYRQIERWWEIISSVYLMVSLHSEQMHGSLTQSDSQLALHQWWDKGIGWKNLLNNLRLILQPFILFNIIKPWLLVFTIPQLSWGFSQLQNIINHLTPSTFFSSFNPILLFSSA